MTTSIKQTWHWIVVIFTILLCPPDLWALEVPVLKNRVNDYAQMLSAGVAGQLETALTNLERTDGTQVVLLTITSLKGDSLEDFSIRVVEQWKLGQKDIDNGVLLLIAKNDRKIRIEVGLGLEGKLTDLVSGRIIRNVITPHFKMGRFDQGVFEGISAIEGVVKGEYTVPNKPRHRRGRSGISPGFIVLIALIFFINMLGRLHRIAGATAGAILAPIAAAILFNPGIALLMGLVPIGFGAGFLVSLMGGPVSFGHTVARHHRTSYWGSGLGGGFGGGGFGGFSGGGGGFGGGGASGGW
jgi:uncharacterized protein